jgi:hypothetical protein
VKENSDRVIGVLNGQAQKKTQDRQQKTPEKMENSSQDQRIMLIRRSG